MRDIVLNEDLDILRAFELTVGLQLLDTSVDRVQDRIFGYDEILDVNDTGHAQQPLLKLLALCLQFNFAVEGQNHALLLNLYFHRMSTPLGTSHRHCLIGYILSTLQHPFRQCCWPTGLGCLFIGYGQTSHVRDTAWRTGAFQSPTYNTCNDQHCTH